MSTAVAFLMALTFLVSIAALTLLIWAVANDQFAGQAGAKTIFAEGEVGSIEDPASGAALHDKLQRASGVAGHTALADEQEELDQRSSADFSSRVPVVTWLTSSIVWLLLGSVFGLISSLKLHMPDLLVGMPELTFGRIRPAHLNAVSYGWASMAGVGVGLWLLPRLFKVPLVGGRYATVGGVLWNLGVLLGIVAILSGNSRGMEWLEFPPQVAWLLTVAGGLAGVPMILTLLKRRVQHLYVSSWYLIAALVWFPLLYLLANIPGMFFGVEEAILNWWFGHNVLGLWFTPLGLAAAYYFIPKIVGEPIYSYSLSLVGFWGIALFYSQVGIHHLAGGPVPTWVSTLSIVHSMMMVVPVIAVAVNQHMTWARHWRMLLYSPTLRFVVCGAVMYTFVSVQGSFEALRSVSQVVHFTHFTVAHAHLGAYGFFSFIMFGSIYFIMPRMMQWEWPYPWAIAVHFWLTFGGFFIYFWWLTVGGILQGLAQLDPAQPFLNSVIATLPYLKARSIGGMLMTLGHVVFATHFLMALLRTGPQHDTPVVLPLGRRWASGEGSAP